MNATTGEDRKRRVVIGWSVVLVLVAAIAIYRYATAPHPLSRYPWKDLPSPTWQGVPAALTAGIESQQYEEGGKYLSNPTALQMATDEQKTAYCYRVVIDFLRALTPEQVNTMRSSPLFFNRLKPEQQRVLLQLASNLGKKDLKRLGSSSAGIFVSDFSYAQKNSLLFSFVVPVGKGAYSGITMSFSVAGRAKRLT